MSDYAFGNLKNLEVSLRQEKKQTEKKGKITAIKIIFCILCALLVAEAIVYFILFPCLNTPQIIWSGVNNYSQKSLVQSLGSYSYCSYIKFNSSQVKSILTTIPGIEDVTIEKKFPDVIRINVVERKAVAKTLISSGERSTLVQIDKNGVIFSVKSDLQSFDGSIPLISGIPVENISEGMRIPAKFRGLMDEIAKIKALPQNYFAAISEIHVVPKEYGNYELVLYPVHSRIKVLTDRHLTEEALSYMMVALDVVGNIEKNVEELDLRYGLVSYRTFNETAGESLE